MTVVGIEKVDIQKWSSNPVISLMFHSQVRKRIPPPPQVLFSQVPYIYIILNILPLMCPPLLCSPRVAKITVWLSTIPWLGCFVGSYKYTPQKLIQKNWTRHKYIHEHEKVMIIPTTPATLHVISPTLLIVLPKL